MIMEDKKTDKTDTPQETAMTEEKKELLTKLAKEDSEFYMLISACTREPYVQCDPETFDDEVLLFFEPEAVKAKAKELADQKIPVTAAKLGSRQMLAFFTTLYTMGVNALRIHLNGSSSAMQIDEIVKKRDKKEMPDGSVWVENPQLHLTSVYFAQELRKPGDENTRQKLEELQEELSADFKRGTFIFAVQKEGKGTPMVKMKNGEKYQPIFTDILEFRKFSKDDAFRPVVVEASQVPKILDKEAKGVILNIMGVNLPLTVTRPGQTGETEKAAASLAAGAEAGAAPGAEAAESAPSGTGNGEEDREKA